MNFVEASFIEQPPAFSLNPDGRFRRNQDDSLGAHRWDLGRINALAL